MAEDPLYTQARELATRLMEDFQSVASGGSNLLYYPKLSEEEVETVRNAYESFVVSGTGWLYHIFRSIWGSSGLTFLASITYARYRTQTGIGFWEGFSNWVTGEENEIDRVRDYKKLLSFFQQYGLFVAEKNKRHYYVSSLYIHAGISPKHLPRILRVLSKIVARFPFVLDDDLVKEVVGEFVHEVADTVVSDGSTIFISDEDNDDEGVTIDLSSVNSLLRYLPLSIRVACYLDSKQMIDEIVALYRIVERILLSGGSFDFDNADLGGNWHLRSSLQLFVDNRDEYSQIGRGLVAGNQRFRRYRTPIIFYDFTSSQLCLLVPEQRLDNEERDRLLFLVTSIMDKSASIEASIPIYTAGGIWRLSEETSITLSRFTDDLTVEFMTPAGDQRKYRVGSQWTLLDGEGLPIRGAPTPGSDVYILVEKSVDFECDESETETDRPEIGFKLFHLFLERNTVFFINHQPIAPCLERVPDFIVSDEHRVRNAFVTPESDQQDHIPIYRDFPTFAFRVGSDSDINKSLSLIVNGSRTEFIIKRESELFDGSGDRRIEILPSEFKVDVNLSICTGEILGVPGSSFRFALLQNFNFSFEHRLSTEINRPRVMQLSFDGAEEAFSKFYEFPSKSDTTRFRIKLKEVDYRLFVEPNRVTWSLSDGTKLPEHLSIADVVEKELLVNLSAGSCRVLATPSESSHSTFLLHSRTVSDGTYAFSLRTLQNVRSGSVNLEIFVSNTTWGVRDFERVPVCTAYASLSFLETPKFTLTSDRSVFKDLAPGLYVTYKAIAESRSKFELSLIDEFGSTVAGTKMFGNGELHKAFLTTSIRDGTYSFRISRGRSLMGRTTLDVETVYAGSAFAVRDGSVREVDDLRGVIFHCIDALQEAIRYNGKTEHFKHKIENFFLKVVDAVEGDKKEFLADGFFIHEGRIQLQHDHNPYIFRIISEDNDQLILRIADSNGEALHIDTHHHINARTPNVLFTTRKIVVVRNEEGGFL